MATKETPGMTPEETTETQAEERADTRDTAGAEEEKTRLSEAAAQLRVGILELETPILARDVAITELAYDFGRLTGMELLEALDADPKGDAIFGKVTNKQAFALFAKAAAKANETLDERDIQRRLTGPGDILNGVRVALAFFRVTSRLASTRIKGV